MCTGFKAVLRKCLCCCLIICRVLVMGLNIQVS